MTSNPNLEQPQQPQPIEGAETDAATAEWQSLDPAAGQQEQPVSEPAASEPAAGGMESITQAEADEAIRQRLAGKLGRVAVLPEVAWQQANLLALKVISRAADTSPKTRKAAIAGSLAFGATATVTATTMGYVPKPSVPEVISETAGFLGEYSENHDPRHHDRRDQEQKAA